MKEELPFRSLNEGAVVNRMIAAIPETRGMPVNAMTQVTPVASTTSTTAAPAAGTTQQGAKQGS